MRYVRRRDEPVAVADIRSIVQMEVRVRPGRQSAPSLGRRQGRQFFATQQVPRATDFVKDLLIRRCR